MHRTTSANNAANMFTNGPPGTVVEQSWLNDVQETIIDPITSAGISLVAGTYTQLTSAIGVLALSTLRAAANTWAQLQTFQKGIIATQSTTNGVGVNPTGNGSGQGVYGKGGASGAPGGEFEGTAGAQALYAFSTASNIVVAQVDGYVDLSGGDNPPASGTVGNNPGKVSKKHVDAAWGVFGLIGSTPASTSVLVSTDALNVASATMQVGYVEVTLATAMAHGQCLVPHLTTNAMTGATGQVGVKWTSTTVVQLKLFESNGTTSIDLTGADARAMTLSFILKGEQ